MYTLIVIQDNAGFGGEDIYVNAVGESYSDIRAAEKARSGYLDVYQKLNPQNVHVIQYTPNA